MKFQRTSRSPLEPANPKIKLQNPSHCSTWLLPTSKTTPINVELSTEVAENPRSDDDEIEAETSKLSPESGTNGNEKKPYPITDAVRRQRATASLKHGLRATTKTAVQLRNRRVRDMVRKAREFSPWIDDADLFVLRGFCELEVVCATLWAILQQEGYRSSGDPDNPKRLLTEYRQLRATQIRYAESLGLSPAARAALQLTTSQIPDLAKAIQDARKAQNGQTDS